MHTYNLVLGNAQCYALCLARSESPHWCWLQLAYVDSLVLEFFVQREWQLNQGLSVSLETASIPLISSSSEASQEVLDVVHFCNYRLGNAQCDTIGSLTRFPILALVLSSMLRWIPCSWVFRAERIATSTKARLFHWDPNFLASLVIMRTDPLSTAPSLDLALEYFLLRAMAIRAACIPDNQTLMIININYVSS